MIDIRGKVFVVTGATGGIGSSLSYKLTSVGAKLIAVGKTAESVERLKKSLGTGHEYVVCDLTDHDSTKRLAGYLKSTGAIDGFIHIAGMGVYKNVPEITEDEWDDSYALHVKSPFLLIQSLIPQLQLSDVSLVMNLGTGAGVIPMRGRSAYCSSKFALRGLTLSLAEEYNGNKPHFCLITLGSTLTSFGGKSVEEKKKEAKSGRAYFPLDWVTDKLMEIIRAGERNNEYTFYPSDFGFGTWKKP